MQRTTLIAVALVVASIGLTERPASAQLMPKAQVANLIAKVENGVDQFRDYLEKRGDNARDAASTAQASGRRRDRGPPRVRRPQPATRRMPWTMPWAT